MKKLMFLTLSILSVCAMDNSKQIDAPEAQFKISPYKIPITIMSEEDLQAFSLIEAGENPDFDGYYAHIRKVSNGTQLFILKQISNAAIEDQMQLIKDCVASTIGVEVNAPVNKVLFIPYNIGTRLKLYPDRAATLHTYAPGNALKEAELPAHFPKSFRLHQRAIDPTSIWQIKYPVLPKQQGLTKSIIESMSFHKSLPVILALDTYIGNVDRSNPNIFYDGNSFYGIDHAATFAHELPSFTCERLTELCQREYFKTCNPTIVESLGIYRDTLLQLYKLMSPIVIINAMNHVAPYLSDTQSNETERRIVSLSYAIKDNHKATEKLIDLLGQIVNAKDSNE